MSRTHMPDVDLLADCIRSVEEKTRSPVKSTEVTSLCCPYCRHPKCHRAGLADSQWQARIATQEERLLVNPNFSDLSLPSHMELHQLSWPSLRKEAMKLEISAQRGDWEPVSDDDVGPTDGIVELASEESQNAVDRALAALARKRGKAPPKIPKLSSGLEDPTGPSLPEHSKPEKADWKSLARGVAPVERRAGSVPLPEDLQCPTCSAPPQYIYFVPKGDGHYQCKLCKTVFVSVGPVEPEAEEIESEPSPSEPPPPEASSSKPPPPVASPYGNLPVPQGGLMIDDGPAPLQKSVPQQDAWAPKKDQVVKPGATIRMGKKDE